MFPLKPDRAALHGVPAQVFQYMRVHRCEAQVMTMKMVMASIFNRQRKIVDSLHQVLSNLSGSTKLHFAIACAAM